MLPGTYKAQKKNGTLYWRSSITYQGRHISLGSFSSESAAHRAYLLAGKLLFEKKHFHKDPLVEIESHATLGKALSFDKWVMLLSLRDFSMYCRNPIYLSDRFFYYCLDADTLLKFDIDDLFFYQTHKISRRGGHLFVADYGMQINLLSRYGIHRHSVAGRDYLFRNGDKHDFRYENIRVINPFYGVFHEKIRGKDVYTVKLHQKGNLLVGHYQSEIEGAVAYNKAVDLLLEKGIKKQYPQNYIESIDEVEYAKIYHQVRLKRSFLLYVQSHCNN